MNRFNTYMANHFSSCRLLARARDTSRNRNVSIHQIPGFWDVVGITDGTDAWVAPCAAGPFFKTATGDVAAILRKMQAGEDPGPVPEAPAPPRARNKLPAETAEPEPELKTRQPTSKRRARL